MFESNFGLPPHNLKIVDCFLPDKDYEFNNPTYACSIIRTREPSRAMLGLRAVKRDMWALLTMNGDDMGNMGILTVNPEPYMIVGGSQRFFRESIMCHI